MTQSPRTKKVKLKPRPKIKLSDKEQSERFREAALSLVATGEGDDFEAIVETIIKKSK